MRQHCDAAKSQEYGERSSTVLSDKADGCGLHAATSFFSALTTFALSRNFVHAVLNVETGRVTFSTSCLRNRQNLHPTTCGSPRFLPCFRIHSALAPNLQCTRDRK